MPSGVFKSSLLRVLMRDAELPKMRAPESTQKEPELLTNRADGNKN